MIAHGHKDEVAACRTFELLEKSEYNLDRCLQLLLI